MEKVNDVVKQSQRQGVSEWMFFCYRLIQVVLDKRPIKRVVVLVTLADDQPVTSHHSLALTLSSSTN